MVGPVGRKVFWSIPGLVESVLGLVPGQRAALHTSWGKLKGWIPRPEGLGETGQAAPVPTQAWGDLGHRGAHSGGWDPARRGGLWGSCTSKSQVPQEMEKERETLQTWKERVGQELDRVVAFWMAHSHDQEYGCASPSFPCPQQGLCLT